MRAIRQLINKPNTFKFSKWAGNEPKFFETVDLYFEEAKKYTNISEDKLQYLKTPNSTLKLNIPLIRDDGTYISISAFRCHHKQHKLPTKGGLRISPKISFDSVEAMAMLNSFQMALMEIPFGGAKGGIKMNSKEFSKREQERIIRRYVIELKKYNFIGPGLDVADPEEGVNSWHMDKMKDTYHTLYGQDDINIPAVVLGKSEIQGGIPNSRLCIGSAVYYAVKKIVEDKDYKDVRNKYGLEKGLKNQKIIIDGFGTMGKNLAIFLQSQGAKIIGIFGRGQNLYNPYGIDIKELCEFIKNKNSFTGFVDHVEGMNLFKQPCDLFVAAHSVRSIHRENVGNLNCKMLIEAANGGLSYNADKILNTKGVLVLPDILCNAGNTIGTYIEWLKNIQHKTPGRLTQKWEEHSKKQFLKGIEKKLKEVGYNVDLQNLSHFVTRGVSEIDIVQTTIESIVQTSLDTVMDKAQKEQCDLRTAAWVIAMERINMATASSSNFLSF